LLAFLRFFANPLVVIYVVASGRSLSLGGPVRGLIVIATILLSVRRWDAAPCIQTLL
jgi:hypothetical protein